ncbi:hypothetical protein [Frigoribacterium sp. RIT-PI-h]|uniref:hypothetical protein n=1 Tax=Frigoribacterium sp. RIT-PI-h TaxID=1690245 RepID=UPI00128F9AEC|nr:hypothetical protein [Frigoribacterium sp. RIT-PI-h]
MTKEDHAPGGKVSGPSTQSMMIVSTVFGGLLAAFAALGDGVTGVTFGVSVTLAVVAVVSAIVGWQRAKSVDALSPFISWGSADYPFPQIAPDRRRLLVRQMVGRQPVAPENAESVRFLIRRKRRRATALMPSLLAMFLILAALAIAAGYPGWGLLGAVLLLGVLVAATQYEKRREDRVLRLADEVDPHEE